MIPITRYNLLYPDPKFVLQRQGIDHKPAFNWWVPHVLKKCDRIISLVHKQTTRYLKRIHKFGIEVPQTVKEALDLDRKNGNTLWGDAITEEMKEVLPTTPYLMGILLQ